MPVSHARWWSLDGTLALLRPHLDPVLVSDAAWTTLSVMARGIPAALADVVYLECRLLADDTRVDLIVRVGAAWLARTSDWSTLRALAPAADSVWLELDADGRPAARATSTFVGFNERQLGSPPRATP